MSLTANQMLKQIQSSVLPVSESRPLIGSAGHFAVFLCALFTVLLPPIAHEIIPTLFILGILVLIYPFALQRLVRPRWLFIMASLFLVNVFFGATEGTYDWVVFGLQLSSAKVINGMLMTLHAIVILTAADAGEVRLFWLTVRTPPDAGP